jgi:hypothetical protein
VYTPNFANFQSDTHIDLFSQNLLHCEQDTSVRLSKTDAARYFEGSHHDLTLESAKFAIAKISWHNRPEKHRKIKNQKKVSTRNVFNIDGSGLIFSGSGWAWALNFGLRIFWA